MNSITVVLLTLLNCGSFNYKPSVVHDGVEPVSNGEHCAVSELTPNRLLNEFIGFQVHRGRGFVENQDLTFTEQRTR